MRTLAAGSAALRRTPIAMLPMTIEGIVAGILVAVGAFPQGAESAISGAIFPLNLYFDLKQSLAFAASWPAFVGVLMLSVLVRGGSLAATLWLAEGRHGGPALAWGNVVRVGALAIVALFPAAVLMYLAAALRYAPFAWLGAVAGFFPIVLFARRGLSIDAGIGTPRGTGVPESPQFLSYAYVLCGLGAAMSSLGRLSPMLAALLIACLGPVHALILLGWREHLRAETFPGGGSLSLGVTVAAVIAFSGAVFYDRVIHNPSPVATADAAGELLLLGGADSTSETGALTELDPRDVGFDRDSATLLSYADGQRYAAADTRRDLDDSARRVAAAVDAAPRPRLLLGHSQAALIVDRIVARGMPAPDRSVVLAPPPPVPPRLVVPPPDRDGRGRVGGDVARGGARLLDLVGLTPFDVDSPASPTNLEPVVVIDKRVSRVAIWALGDSVWLDTDWRRPGELNLVAVTDHVGVVNNRRALEAARHFLNGRSVEGDEVSWRGFAASVLRYVFEPWRPG